MPESAIFPPEERSFEERLQRFYVELRRVASDMLRAVALYGGSTKGRYTPGLCQLRREPGKGIAW
jgi:hypothetical protein